ncbi:MAG TPA: galactokinase, partial [Tepidisphaeraceae bacterium]|nr:galactokinase [Tepidisphaeraceae bacterium]
NLIGEHTDYNCGLVLPMAIERYVFGICRTRSDSRLVVESTAFPGERVDIELDGRIESRAPQWTNYSKGVAAEMLKAGIPLVGMDLLLHNTLPVGGGLSSSAAILVATGLSLLAGGGNRMDADRLALICQQAERNYANVPCGIMDQTAVASSRAGHAMLLDCRDHSKHFVPIDSKELRVVIANTMVHHELSDGAYAARVDSCNYAVSFFQARDQSVRSLRDVSPEQVQAAKGTLDDTTYRRAKHVVTEIERCRAAAELLGKRRYEDVGVLMQQSHDSLRLDYEVSCAELDFLVNESLEAKGVYGARMTGGGFGGCIVALAQPRMAEGVIEHLRHAYKRKFGIDATVFSTAAAAGAGLAD